MRRHELAGARLSLALVLVGCTVAAPASVPVSTGSASPATATHQPASDAPLPSAAGTSQPSDSVSAPTSSAAPSHNSAAVVVRDAALASAEAGTLRFEVEIRSAEPADDVPRITGRGQVSFAEPIQFRYHADEFTGRGGTSPESEVIFDNTRFYGRGRDGVVDSPETWLVVEFDEFSPGQVFRERYLEQYGDALFVLVPALGITHAELAGVQTINGASTTHYIGRSNPDVPLALLPAVAREPYRQKLEARQLAFQVRGISRPLPDVEVEVWIDPAGRIVRLGYVQDVESGDIEALVITYDFDAFGAPMDVAPPEGAEVLTMAELQVRYGNASAPPSPPT